MISDFSALIYSQVCGIIITIVVLILYLMQKKLPIRNRMYFMLVSFFTLLTNIIDVVSVLLNTYVPEQVSALIFSKIYLVVMCITLLLVILYITNDVLPKKKYRIILWSCSAVCLFLCIIMSVTKITVVDIYTEGIGVTAIYVTAGMIITFNIIFAILHRKEMNPGKAKIIIIWMIIWTILSGVQFLFPKFLVVSFGLSVGVMIIYIKLENLDNYLDIDTGLFSFSSYLKYIKDLELRGEECQVVYVKAGNITSVDDIILAESMKKFNTFLRKRNDIIPFSSGYDYILVFNGIPLDTCKKMLWDYRNSDYIVGVHYNAFYFENGCKLNTIESILDVISTITETNQYRVGTFVEVDASDVQSKNNLSVVDGMIRDAIVNDRVVVYYQPIYSIEEQRFTSAEALVRIIDTDGNIIPPYKFIPVAEKSGLISNLDEVVFDKVCRFIDTNKLQKLGLDYIEINVSAMQFSSYTMAEKYISIVDKYSFNPKSINLEITESTNMDYQKVYAMNLDKLVEHGFTFSLDDFGTGYSNLNQVTKMPIDIVKFDKQMTDAYFTDAKGRYVLKDSMDMLKHLGFKIVVEGVETKEQLEEMKNCNADFIQGYYFSKPIPEKEFIELIKKNL